MATACCAAGPVVVNAYTGSSDDNPGKTPSAKAGVPRALHEDPGQHERGEIERQLQEVDMALNLLDQAGPGRVAMSNR